MSSSRRSLRGMAGALFMGALLAMGLTSTPAFAKGGGGVNLSAVGATTASGASAGFVGIGGQFVNYPILRLRTGAELNALAGQTGAGLSGGVFGDFVFARIANADLFLGLGLGVGGGSAFGGGAAIYGRPEFGVQWNLGRMAIEAKGHVSVTGALGAERDPIPFAGLSVGLLFGNFPIDGWNRPGPGRYRNPPPPPRRHRRAPPPPPPPRGY